MIEHGVLNSDSLIQLLSVNQIVCLLSLLPLPLDFQ